MKDNFNVNGIEDYMVEDANVSEILRINRIKAQRNAEAKAKMKYKNRLEILITLLVMAISLITIYECNKITERDNQNCMKYHTQQFCERGM